MGNKKNRKIDDDFDMDFMEDNSDEKEHHSFIPVLIAILLIVIIGGAAVGSKVLEKYSYSKETMDLYEYFHVSDDSEAAIILGDEIIEPKAFVSNGEYYLPLDFVQSHINSRFYYDKNDALLLYTTPTQLFEIPADSTSYIVSGEQNSYTQTIYTMKDQPYVSAGFLSQFANFVIDGFDSPSRVQIYENEITHHVAKASKNTDIRYQGGIKSDILSSVEKGQTLYILEKMENWSKVKANDGVIGYVENKRLNEQEDETIQMPQNYIQPEYTSIHKDYMINLAWHQVTNEVANSGVDGLLENTKAINTISPTWFFLNDNAGNFTSIASQEYVNNMHQRGIEVWALIDNFTNDVDISQILGTLPNRKNLISNLIQTVQAYQIDGINIDFEQVPNEAGGDYVQFLRELSIACRANQVVLSVDNYVPTGYTAHYDRREQGTVVDYVIIMGYDEHYGGSDQAGSVASLDYVRQGIEKTVEVVPSEKVINGVPFYTRLWKLADGVSSDSLSMSAAEAKVAENNAQISWDEATSQNYATWEADGATYQIWLEDEESLKAKINVMSMYPLGGIAQWKLGLEKPQVWDIIADYVNNSFVTEAYVDTDAAEANATTEASEQNAADDAPDPQETEAAEAEAAPIMPVEISE